MNRISIKYSDVSSDRLLNGGWLLSAMVGDRLISCRYFEYSLREAKQRFIAEIKAGAF